MKHLTMAVIAALAVAVTLVVVSSALAASATTTQPLATPGITKRVIWDETQVMIRKLPDGVNHNGFIHMELTFRPTTSDLDLYLLDEEGNVLSEEMGYMGVLSGMEVVDHMVTNVVNTAIDDNDTPADPADDFMVGDVYYVVVVAFNGAAEYQVWGYYPQIDLAVGASTSSPENYYLQSYRYPAKSTKWARIAGPIYGGRFDFRPTSQGDGDLRLQWPADIDTKAVTFDPAKPMTHNVEQYLYVGKLWEYVLGNYGTDDNFDPPLQDEGTADPLDDWYGLKDAFSIKAADRNAVTMLFPVRHYVPSLFLAYEDPLVGPAGPPKTGRTTLGYKATVTWPENLRISKVTKYSTYYKLRGTYSLGGARVPSGKVTIQFKTAATALWRDLKTVTCDANGVWTAKVRPKVRWSLRVKAPGADPTGLTDLAVEYSLVKKLAKL